MNPTISKLTVSDARYFRAGDIVRMVSTGEVLHVTAARGGQPRYWEPIPLHEAIWNWLRRRGWKRTRVTERYRTIIRGYRGRPSPLPRRLP